MPKWCITKRGQEPQCGPNRETFVGQKDYVRGPRHVANEHRPPFRSEKLATLRYSGVDYRMGFLMVKACGKPGWEVGPGKRSFF
jgi:hypothetical protein